MLVWEQRIAGLPRPVTPTNLCFTPKSAVRRPTGPGSQARRSPWRTAQPAIFYGNRFYGPFRATHPHALAYLDRLIARPFYARALEEAKPFMHLLPK